ncbi:hypothetical protein JHK82_043620 [Glycine max]|nr:hypothetical protein JHK86_043507 [Glycine max]KAG5106650.1 hypothetical protein JHK82_043620 [Glycine max]KAG5117579.1 hypothetical protein JHK84_043692 [Glycine max]
MNNITTIKFNSNGLTLFEKEVVKVEKKGTEWVVEWKRKSQKGDSLSREGLDAAIVCSGHSAEPKLAEVLGIDTWHGVHMHSYNYRVPQPFNNQVVILIGLFDISRDIAHVAKEVHTATRLNPDLAGMKFGDYGNIMFHTTAFFFVLITHLVRLSHSCIHFGTPPSPSWQGLRHDHICASSDPHSHVLYEAHTLHWPSLGA